MLSVFWEPLNRAQVSAYLKQTQTKTTLNTITYVVRKGLCRIRQTHTAYNIPAVNKTWGVVSKYIDFPKPKCRPTAHTHTNSYGALDPSVTLKIPLKLKLNVHFKIYTKFQTRYFFCFVQETKIHRKKKFETGMDPETQVSGLHPRKSASS
jgi:hypothetical protein